MSRKIPKPEDEILEALLEDERMALIVAQRERGQSDDEE